MNQQPNFVKTAIYKYVLKVLQAYYRVECNNDQYIVYLQKSDDLYFPCKYAIGAPDASSFANQIEIVSISLSPAPALITNVLEYAVGHTINKIVNKHLLRMQTFYTEAYKISELEAIRQVLERYNIYEDEYSFETNHKAFMRDKKKVYLRRHKRYKEGFKKRIVKEITDGKLSYRAARKKYNIGSQATIRNWITQYG